MDSARQDLLFGHFTTLAESLVDGLDVTELADQVMHACVDLLEVGAAGLLLDNQRGGLEVLASSSDEVIDLEVLEMQRDAGPCHEAFVTGVEVVVDDVDAWTDEWPDFVKAARSHGVRAAAAVPLVVDEVGIGALNLFRMEATPFSARDRQIARFLCSVAAIGIMQHQRTRDQEALAGQLRTALDSRVSIEQAKGVIAARAGVTVAAAFEMLRSAARASQRSLTEVATEVVNGRIPTNRLLDSPAPRRGNGRRARG